MLYDTVVLMKIHIRRSIMCFFLVKLTYVNNIIIYFFKEM